MYKDSNLKNIVNQYHGVKKIIVRIVIKLNAPIIHMMDRNAEVAAESFRMHLEGQNSKLNDLNERLDRCGEALAQVSMKLESYEGALENIRNLNRQLSGYEDVIVNLQNNNIRLEKIESMQDMHGVKIAKLEKLKSASVIGVANEKEKKLEEIKQIDTAYASMDYFEFENYFRGSREEIKRNQAIYIKYFRSKNHVLDLGCGRGEFLELLKENKIGGYGIDIYPEFVDLCIAKNLKAVCRDAITALEQEDAVDGIFAGQLIEHLHLSELLHLIETAYDKLTPGSYLILETPNPMSLAIYTHAFYMDPSHNKPVHPLTLKYLLEKAGFREIEVIFTQSSKLPVEIPKLQADGINNLQEFNQAMQEVQRTLFGSQDYAVAAKK